MYAANFFIDQKKVGTQSRAQKIGADFDTAQPVSCQFQTYSTEIQTGTCILLRMCRVGSRGVVKPVKYTFNK